MMKGRAEGLPGRLAAAVQRLWRPWRRARSSLTAITWLLTLGVLIVWGTSMYGATSVAAEYAAARYVNGYGEFASTLAAYSLEHWLGKGYERNYENYHLNRLWEAVDKGGQANSFHSFSAPVEGVSGFLPRLDRDEVHSAAAIFDPQGNLLVCSWEDFFYFEYLTQAQWTDRQERSGNCARAVFDRSKLTPAGQEMVRRGDLTFGARALRFTGSFDGVEFTPQTIAYIDWDEFDDALFSRGSGAYTVSGVVQDDGLPWIPLYDDPQALPPGAETVTLYSDWFDVCCQQSSASISYQGQAYDSLGALITQLGAEYAGGWKNLARYEGLDLILPSVNYCTSVDGALAYTPHYYGEAAYGAESPQVEFYLVTVVCASPWRTAWGELRGLYILTLLLAAVIILLVRTVIKRHLVDPAGAAGETLAALGGKGELVSQGGGGWREVRLLQGGLAACRDTLRMQSNEITRLNTALTYARQAEENRRQMTSALAHELKTPLAVIHSYAEGLKEHVAEEKRDKYLDVILSETERTDSIVLEMLDLSRLEAGKVRLSRDEVSLIGLTRAALDKLALVAQAKGLRIDCTFPEDFTVTADESRMAQVIENFASNAVKYTPAGGHVAVTIQHRGGKTTFSIENDCAPLSEEALSRVWETFYRSDESRTGVGTGLGLAIAKNIIALHGGACWARNTAAGVIFGFVIGEEQGKP